MRPTRAMDKPATASAFANWGNISHLDFVSCGPRRGVERHGIAPAQYSGEILGTPDANANLPLSANAPMDKPATARYLYNAGLMSSPEFYANARAYDIAFGDRDFKAECDFLEWCWREHGATSERAMVELACGPGRHALAFARRGWRAVGLDMSEDMLAYGEAIARQTGVTVEWQAADMRDYTLAAPVGIAASMMESLTHLVTNEDVVTHLRAVARNLVPGGVLIIEMAHPSTLGREHLPNTWTMREGDMQVDILFGRQDDPYDWVTQQWIVTTRLTIRQHGLPVRVVEHITPIAGIWLRNCARSSTFRARSHRPGSMATCSCRRRFLTTIQNGWSS